MQLRFRAFIFCCLAFALPCLATPNDFLLCRQNTHKSKFSSDSEALIQSVVARLQAPAQLLTNESLPSVTISQSTLPSASISGLTVTISEGMLELTTNESEIAFILAHEISHRLLGHQHTSTFLGLPDSQHDEIEADRLALALMKSTGSAARKR